VQITGVDQKKCSGCGLCVRECVTGRFSVDGNQTARYSDPENWCIGCGHCVAVCPQNAVCYTGQELAQEIKSGLCGFESIRDFLLTKRSVRRYQDKDVPGEIIEKILEVMRFAPSSRNAQPCEYAIVKDPEIKRMLANAAIKSSRSFRQLIRVRKLLRPFIPKALSTILDTPGTASATDDLIEKYESGMDNIFFDAPVLLLVHVPFLGGVSYIEPTIAVTYGMLAAHALGLGSCYIGLAMVAAEKNRKILSRLYIPRGRRITGIMTLGYPRHTYRRIPARNPVKAEWFV
jgi:nitroreductase/NAD-dependent dihydropyrimidine dehydrogenase PreA subunit